jgi:signal transduction histidine kinase
LRWPALGLGLTLAAQLARIMGGRVSVESVVGEGSEFRLHLPLGEPLEA